jgi:predicted metal-binding protein
MKVLKKKHALLEENLEGMSLNMIWKKLSLSELMKYHKPELVEGYCKQCSNYNLNWSCPPHDRDVLKAFLNYKSVIVFGVKTKNFTRTKSQLTHFLISISDKLPCHVLISGNCDLCNKCSKPVRDVCTFPRKMKYSLESLGFHVSDICEKVLGVPLTWDSENPEYFAVAAIFYPSELELTVKKYLREGVDIITS